MGRATRDQLRRIASEGFWEDWELIAQFLGVDSDTIADINKNNTSMTSKIFKMLKKWSQQQGSKGTYKRLVSTLENAPRGILSDRMKQSPSEISSSEPSSSTPNCFEDQNESKGRLKKLEVKDIKSLRDFCQKTVFGFGNFGTLYKSRGEIPGLDIHVLLKEILVKNDKDKKMDKKMASITNEKLASRTMHFAIVPLLAYGADDSKNKPERAFCFITPYLEKGNLAKAIQNDSKSVSPVLTLPLRMKIMYHIASAIDFLHTPVPKFRGTILHLNIKSTNIVLDQWYNARLGEFGLAREMGVGSDSRNTDYSHFGVVIRELLTGDGNKCDKLIHSRPEAIIRRSMTLWKNRKGKAFKVPEKLCDLSTRCLESLPESSLESRDINSKEILNTIQELMTVDLHSTWDFEGKLKKCDMCMRYDAVDDTFLDHNKNCKMRVCVSCMRHSYCNPIFCHTCGKEIIPNIGNGWDAVLIAGNDVKKKKLAEVFSKDVEAVKKVITSKCPLVMGISEARVLTLKPVSPGKGESMKDKLNKRLDKFLIHDNKGKPYTLVLYFSGHGSKENGLMLGNEDEFLSIEDLQKYLLTYTEQDQHRYVRLIIFLDCCYAPWVKVDNFRDNIMIVQLNACTRDSRAVADETDSVFQRLFTQALTRRALSSKCMNHECKDCGIDNDFVTPFHLQKYIEKHYNAHKNASDFSEPKFIVYNAGLKDISIGYVVNFCVDLKFYFELKGKDDERVIPHSLFCNIEEIKTKLFDEYVKMRSTGQGPHVSSTFFHDVIFIFSKDGPTDDDIHELDTLEEVNMAWVCRKELHVSLRAASRKTGTHSVGVFFENTSVEPVVDYLFKKDEPKRKIDKNTVEYTTDFEDFRTFLQSQQQRLDEVFTVVKGLRNAKCELEKEQKVVTKISVKFPYNKYISPKYRTDFLCFGLLVD